MAYYNPIFFNPFNSGLSDIHIRLRKEKKMDLLTYQFQITYWSSCWQKCFKGFFCTNKFFGHGFQKSDPSIRQKTQKIWSQKSFEKNYGF